MPEQWTRLLTSSAITKEDYAKNPQAVLDVLEFYTESQKREREDFGAVSGYDYPQFAESGTDSNVRVGNNQVSRFGAGTGLAGQRLDSLSPLPIPPQAVSRSGDVNSSPSTQRMDSISKISLARQNTQQRADGTASKQQDAASSPAGKPSIYDVNVSATDDRMKVTPPAASAVARLPTGNRSDLVPQRRAPAVPASTSTRPFESRNDGKSSINVKPLVTQTSSRLAVPQTSTKNGANDDIDGQTKDASTSVDLPLKSTTATLNKTANAPPRSAAANTAVKSPNSGERRISKMTESEIQAKLRQVTSPLDPSRIYTRIKKVGQGASGSVYVAKINETGEKVAIKQMDLANQPRKELIVNEILVMKESRHDNIVNFRESYLVKQTELWVVMDYMEGGALTDVIDNHTLEEDQISCICKEVCSLLPFITYLFKSINRHAPVCNIYISSISYIATSKATTFY